MNKNWALALFFKLTSIVTDRFPNAGAKVLNLFSFWLMGNAMLMNINRKSMVKKLRSIEKPEKILVVADLNIGDAVNLQAAFTALRDFFPKAMLDYAIADCAHTLVKGNPEITNVYPVFTGRPFPNAKDRKELKRITTETKYDIIFNFCAFFDERKDFSGSDIIISYVGIAYKIMHDEQRPIKTNHIVYQAYHFIRGLLAAVFVPVRKERFDGIGVAVADSAVLKAKEFLCTVDGFHFGIPLIYFNPDASSVFTLVPFKTQTAILNTLLHEIDGLILLGKGFSFPNVENALWESIPITLRNRVALVPDSIGLDGMAALIDFCDAYVGGDTGPLHIAASKKYASSGKGLFINETAVYSIFGATPPRIYGYDSTQMGFFPSNQNAPSKAYVAASPCRNMTCINKRAKTCKQIHCFDSLNTYEIVKDISQYLFCKRRTFAQLAVA